MNMSLKEFLRYELKTTLSVAEDKYLEKLSNSLEDESSEQEEIIAKLTRDKELMEEQLDFARDTLVQILNLCVTPPPGDKNNFVVSIKACIEESYVDL